MENNLKLYNSWRTVPKEAKKTIDAGRLKGFTDISPMWRIQQLTTQFGPCGIGWKAPITRTWIDDGAGDVKVCNVEIALQYKMNGEWSEPITGIGGSQLVSKEKGGPYTDDEAYKKAYTDALGVACKSLGMGADVYWEQGSKYDAAPQEPIRAEDLPTYAQVEYADKNAREALYAACGNDKERYDAILRKYNVPKTKIPMDVYNQMYREVWDVGEEELPWEK